MVFNQLWFRNEELENEYWKMYLKTKRIEKKLDTEIEKTLRVKYSWYVSSSKTMDIIKENKIKIAEKKQTKKMNLKKSIMLKKELGRLLDEIDD